jgi:hypothetical protein
MTEFTAPVKEFQKFTGVWESNGLAATVQIYIESILK